MDEKSSSITRLLGLIRTAFRRDWREQRRKGQRNGAPSMEQTSKDLNVIYPEMSEGFLKKIYIYNKEEPPKPIEFRELKTFIEFLFVHQYVDYGWPNVAQAVREFEDGRFAPLVDRYAARGRKSVSDVLSPDLLVSAGATPDVNPFTQLIQLAVIAKSENEQQYRRLADKNNKLASENQKLSAANKEFAEILTEVKSLISSIQDKINRGEATPDQTKELDKAKKILDSLTS